jgi:hypothetical protein
MDETPNSAKTGDKEMPWTDKLQHPYPQRPSSATQQEQSLNRCFRATTQASPQSISRRTQPDAYVSSFTKMVAMALTLVFCRHG